MLSWLLDVAMVMCLRGVAMAVCFKSLILSFFCLQSQH